MGFGVSGTNMIDAALALRRAKYKSERTSTNNRKADRQRCLLWSRGLIKRTQTLSIAHTEGVGPRTSVIVGAGNEERGKRGAVTWVACLARTEIYRLCTPPLEGDPCVSSN